MKAETIREGLEYEVEAPNTNSSEIWTVVKINGEEITCKGSKTSFVRTFLAEQVKGIHKHMADEIISESIEVVGQIMGCDMCVERIDHMPFHKRRGRKPRSEANG